MASLLSVGTAQPPLSVGPVETKVFLAETSGAKGARTFGRMVDATRIARRNIVIPVSQLRTLRTVSDRMKQYEEHVVALSERAIRTALTRAGIAPESIGTIVSASCTGYLLPSLDARLIYRMGFNPACRRVPLTELGCSAGVNALGLAATLAHANLGSTVLVVVVELCSLCVQTSEPSRTDALGTMLFGDGAAAAVVASPRRAATPDIVASRSVVWPDSTDELGMRLGDTGMRLVLSPAVPGIVRRYIRFTVEDFLDANALTRQDIGFWVLHPGGPRIMDAMSEELGLSEGALKPTREVWEQQGNTSAATVFFVLEHLRQTSPPSHGELGLMVAVGPGVTCELVLLRWNGKDSAP